MAGGGKDRNNKSQGNDSGPQTLQELMTGYQRELQRAFRPLHHFWRQSTELLRPYAELQRELQKHLRRWAEFAQQLQEPMGHWAGFWEQLARVLRDAEVGFRSWMELLAEAGKQYGIALDEAVPVLERYRWFVSPSLPAPFVFYVVREGRKPGRRDKSINRLFADYFAAHDCRPLREMVDGWEGNALFSKRLGILRDCVTTLQAGASGRFNAANVVLPTVLAQIDGVLSDYLESKGLNRTAPYTVKKQHFRKLKSKSLPAALEDLACFVLLDILFQSALPGQNLKTPFNFNRHKIMHGENVRYGRKDYVIRAFLVLDLLAHLH